MKVETPAVDTAAEGTGAPPNTTCNVTITDQVALAGQPTQVTIKTSSTGSISSISVPALSYGQAITGLVKNTTYNIAGYYTEPVSGCGLGPSGGVQPALYVYYQVLTATVVPSSSQWTTAPPRTTAASAVTPVSSGGTGLTLSCTVNLGTVSYGIDNTGAFTLALAAMQAQNNMPNQSCVYIPAGNYMLKPIHTGGNTSTNAAYGFGSWIGDAQYNSTIFVIPNTAGDVFAWYNSNSNGAAQTQGNTFTWSQNNVNTRMNAGAKFSNITIVGNRYSSAFQNGLAFYGFTEWASIENCSMEFLRGSAIVAGLGSGSGPSGDIRESRISDCRFEYDGDSTGSTVSTSTSSPAVWLTSTGSTTEAINDMELTNLRFFDEWGPSLVIDSPSGLAANTNPTQLWLLNLKFEESAMSQQYEVNSSGSPVSVLGDELQAGDPLSSGLGIGVTNLLCGNMEFTNPILGWAALHIGTGSSNVDCNGQINGTRASPGRGLQIDDCQTCSFRMAGNATIDYNVALGYPSSGISQVGAPCATDSLQAGYPIIYDGDGAEAYGGGGTGAQVTVCLDAAGQNVLRYPVRQTYEPQNTLNAQYLPLGSAVSQVTSTTGTTLTVGGTGLVAVSAVAPLWQINRTGPAAIFSDVWDTAAHFLSALGAPYASSPVQVNNEYHAQICNNTAYFETILATAGSTGITASTFSIPGNSCQGYTLTVTSLSAAAITISSP